jgi:hypothetical protein
MLQVDEQSLLCLQSDIVQNGSVLIITLFIGDSGASCFLQFHPIFDDKLRVPLFLLNNKFGHICI